MINDINGNENLYFQKRDLGRAVKAEMGYGYFRSKIVRLNDGTKNPANNFFTQSDTQQDRTILHELSHFRGTNDREEQTWRFGEYEPTHTHWSNNAGVIEWIAEGNRTFINLPDYRWSLTWCEQGWFDIFFGRQSVETANRLKAYIRDNLYRVCCRNR